MKARWLFPAVAILLAAPVSAQNLAGAIKPQYDQVKGWIIASAEMVSEADYSFKPTPAVRSFGELVGHVADASYAFCSGATGKASTAPGPAEKLPTKAELVKAVKDAFAFCDSAYTMADGTAQEQVAFFGQNGSRLWVLAWNVSHDFEHYGNMVTYMRMKGLVPPSSAGG